jgi:hypothetical protein
VHARNDSLTGELNNAINPAETARKYISYGRVQNLADGAYMTIRHDNESRSYASLPEPSPSGAGSGPGLGPVSLGFGVGLGFGVAPDFGLRAIMTTRLKRENTVYRKGR